MDGRAITRKTNDSRRAEIIHTARNIITHKGYAYLTAGTICTRMHVARPLLYHYFHGSEQVAQEIIMEQILQFETFVRQWVIMAQSTSLSMCIKRSAMVVKQAIDCGLLFVGGFPQEKNSHKRQRIPDGNEELIAQYVAALMKRNGKAIAETIGADAHGCPRASENNNDFARNIGNRHMHGTSRGTSLYGASRGTSFYTAPAHTSSASRAQSTRLSQLMRPSVQSNRNLEELLITVMWGIVSRSLLTEASVQKPSQQRIERMIKPIVYAIANDGGLR